MSSVILQINIILFNNTCFIIDASCWCIISDAIISLYLVEWLQIFNWDITKDV